MCVQRIPHTCSRFCDRKGTRREQLLVAAVVRLKLIVGFLSVGNREGCQKDTPAVQTVLLHVSWLPA